MARDAEYGEMEARIKALEEDVATLKTDVAILRVNSATKEDFYTLQVGLQNVMASIDALKLIVATKADIAAIRAEFATKAEVETIKIDVETLKTDMAIIKSNYVTKADLESLRTELHKVSRDSSRWAILLIVSMITGFLGLYWNLASAIDAAPQIQTRLSAWPGPAQPGRNADRFIQLHTRSNTPTDSTCEVCGNIFTTPVLRIT